MTNVYQLRESPMLSIWIYNNRTRIGQKTQKKTYWKKLFEKERSAIAARGGNPIFAREDSQSSSAGHAAKYALFVEFGSHPFIDQQIIAPNTHTTLVIAMMPNPLEAGGTPRITFYEYAHCKKSHLIHADADRLFERIKYRHAREVQFRKRKRQLTLI